MKYKVVLEPCEEGFAVSVPSLPGCHSQGNTEQEALQNISNAIYEYMNSVKDLFKNKIIKEVEVEITEATPAKTTVFDVAQYILDKCGSMSALKLQKLVYYAQAWSLVWDDEPLFAEDIEAWAGGPMVRTLYNAHRGGFQVDANTFIEYPTNDLSQNQKDTIDTVLEGYADKSVQWLNDQTRIEQPWLSARKGLPDTDRGGEVISLESMAEYYGSLG